MVTALRALLLRTQPWLPVLASGLAAWIGCAVVGGMWYVPVSTVYRQPPCAAALDTLLGARGGAHRAQDCEPVP